MTARERTSLCNFIVNINHQQSQRLNQLNLRNEGERKILNPTFQDSKIQLRVILSHRRDEFKKSEKIYGMLSRDIVASTLVGRCKTRLNCSSSFSWGTSKISSMLKRVMHCRSEALPFPSFQISVSSPIPLSLSYDRSAGSFCDQNSL